MEKFFTKVSACCIFQNLLRTENFNTKATQKCAGFGGHALQGPQMQGLQIEKTIIARFNINGNHHGNGSDPILEIHMKFTIHEIYVPVTSRGHV